MQQDQITSVSPNSTNVVLGEGGQLQPTPLPVSFLEWVSFEGYMRLSEKAGHKWFKMKVVETYTTAELYNVFVKEIEDENRANDLDEYNKQLEFEASRFGGL